MAIGPQTAGKLVEDLLERRYDRLQQDREPFLSRARDCALLTIPMLLPKEGTDGTTKFYKPYQSIGARGVNNLANKLLLALLPPNEPFFKLSADDATIADISDEKDRAKIEEKFNEIERTVQMRVETKSFRAPFITALKQLIVAGNTLLIIKPNEKVRVIRLDHYVVRRNPEGDVLEIIIKEETRLDDLPDDVKALIQKEDGLPSDTPMDKDLAIYTTYKLDGKKFVTFQTVRGHEVPGSRGTYPADRPPFIALRWTHEDNEDYGRSYVEEYIGDLQTSEGLSKAVVEASAAAAKIIIAVNPNGLTREEDVAEAENLDVITGREEDVSLLQLAKQADMAIAKDTLNDIIQRLSYAFLMNTAVQRNAERVTAEEIREMIKELEDALGGTYALFAQEFQLPFVRILMANLTKEKRIPDLAALKKDGIEVEPTITTGVEAIGRGHDLSKLQIFMREFVAPLGEQGLNEINIPDLLKRGGTSLGIDMDGLVKNEDQKAAEAEGRQQAQQEQMMQETIAKGAQAAAGPVAKAAMEQQ